MLLPLWSGIGEDATERVHYVMPTLEVAEALKFPASGLEKITSWKQLEEAVRYHHRGGHKKLVVVTSVVGKSMAIHSFPLDQLFLDELTDGQHHRGQLAKDLKSAFLQIKDVG